MSANTSTSKSPLLERRNTLESYWNQFTQESTLPQSYVSDDISSSWQRSSDSLPNPVDYAPEDKSKHYQQTWQTSGLHLAAQKEQNNMKQLAKEGEMVAAIADNRGCLMWSYASQHMQNRAESVNFQAGGRWDEHSIGTNAIGLSKTLRRPVTVFSSEHYQPFLHDWVCYAAPIIHPTSGECVGILDISTTWNKHTALGQAGVTQLAQNIANALPAVQPKAELEIKALGQMRVNFRGKLLTVNKRQIEMLCLLALNPEGLSLNAFHNALYGDNPVSMNTLKAEISHLRGLLDGQIGSRPYRLLMPVWSDFIELWKGVYQDNTVEAFELYQGPLLATSESPEIEEWRHCIDAVMAKLLNTCQDPKELIQKISTNQTSNEMVRERLLEIIN